MEEEKIKGKVVLAEDGHTRKTYFEGCDEPVVSATNPDLVQLGIAPKTRLPHSHHLVTSALGS